jgi:hypothetical protein
MTTQMTAKDTWGQEAEGMTSGPENPLRIFKGAFIK